MSINEQNHVSFNRMILAAVKDHPDDLHWPDDDILWRYMEGHADTEQCELFQSWLLASPRLRLALVDLYDNLQNLDSIEGQKFFERIKVSEMPLVKKVIYQQSPIGHLYEKARKACVALKNLFNVRIMVPAVAVATAVIITITQLLPTAHLQYADRLEPSQYISPITRGADNNIDIPIFKDAKEAVLNESRYWLWYDINLNEFVFKHSIPITTDPPIKKISIELFDHEKNKTISTAVDIPTPLDLKSDRPVEIWLLTVPSLEIWNGKIESDRIEIQWPGQNQDNRGILIVTYPTAEGYTATGGITFELKR